MTQIERTGFVYVWYIKIPLLSIWVLHDCKCEVRNATAFMCFVVVFIQKRLLLNIHIGYFSVVTPNLGCLTFIFLTGGHCDPHLKFLSGALLIYTSQTTFSRHQGFQLGR